MNYYKQESMKYISKTEEKQTGLRKRLVMVGIRRKGEKGFKKQIDENYSGVKNENN